MDKGGPAGSLVSNRCNRCNRCNHLLQLLHSLTSKREQEAGSDEELTASICKVIQSLIGGLRQGISTRESIFERLIRSPPATLDHPTTANHFQPRSQRDEVAALGRVGHARRLRLPNLTAVGKATFHSALHEEKATKKAGYDRSACLLPPRCLPAQKCQSALNFTEKRTRTHEKAHFHTHRAPSHVTTHHPMCSRYHTPSMEYTRDMDRGAGVDVRLRVRARVLVLLAR